MPLNGSRASNEGKIPTPLYLICITVSLIVGQIFIAELDVVFDCASKHEMP